LRLLGERRTIVVLLPFLIWSIATYALYTFVTPLLEAHLPPTDIAPLLLVFGVGSVVGNLVGGAIYDAFGTSRPTVLCLMALIAALAAVRPANVSPPAIGADMVIWAMSMAALYTLQQQRTIAVGPEQSNLRLALNNSADYLGVSIGSAVGGVVILRSSIDALPIASATTATIGLVTLILFPGKAPLAKAVLESPSSIDAVSPEAELRVDRQDLEARNHHPLK
jgi:predicted MFS family arabinose efflux permease